MPNPNPNTSMNTNTSTRRILSFLLSIFVSEKEINFVKKKKLDKVLIFTNLISLVLFVLKRQDTAIKFAIFSLKLAVFTRIVYVFFIFIAFIVSMLRF